MASRLRPSALLTIGAKAMGPSTWSGESALVTPTHSAVALFTLLTISTTCLKFAQVTRIAGVFG